VCAPPSLVLAVPLYAPCGRASCGGRDRLSRLGIKPDDLVTAVRTATRGEALLSPAVTRTVIARSIAAVESAPRPVIAELAALTAREREVVTLVAAGLSNDDIAARLVVSPLTAKTHVARAMAKTGVRDWAQLVIFAYETGLVTAGENSQRSTPPQ
jgi:DNA-binding NarL/FixJ family response regulator